MAIGKRLLETKRRSGLPSLFWYCQLCPTTSESEVTPSASINRIESDMTVRDSYEMAPYFPDAQTRTRSGKKYKVNGPKTIPHIWRFVLIHGGSPSLRCIGTREIKFDAPALRF